MQSKSSQLTIHRTFIVVGLTLLTALFGFIAPAETRDQTDWKQWAAKDVHNILYSSPWVSNCCREWDEADGGGTASLGISASIVSSNVVRQALVKRMQFTRAYVSLDASSRQDIEKRSTACLNERFDDRIIVSFSFDLPHGPYPQYTNSSSQIHILTSDGRDVFGHQESESIAERCGGLYRDLDPSPNFDTVWALYGPHHELAFPRFVDGKPTIGPNDKEIRIVLDFYLSYYHAVSHGGEIDFRIDKLIYQGKPDF